MVKSVRLDPALEKQLEQGAKVSGVPVSVLIREAVKRRCEEVLGHALQTDRADIIGAIHTEGGRARRTGAAFKEVLTSRTTP
ncbi:MAG: ribbon-helix-helix protein, CopG family [Chloroflexota bacterium]